MFIIPLDDDIEIRDDYEEILIDDGLNYIINFLFHVIEGGPKVYVCGIEREGLLGLRVKLFNKNGQTTKIRMYKLLTPHLLATNHNSRNPIVIAETLNNLTITPGYSEIPIPRRPSDQSPDSFYYYMFNVITGSRQVYVSNVKTGRYPYSVITLGFFNEAPIDAQINLSLLDIDFLIGHDPRPAPHDGTDLRRSDVQRVNIDNLDFGRVELHPSRQLATVISYTFTVSGDIRKVYVCGQYYDNQGLLNVEFFNESGRPVSVEVSGWETFPFGAGR